MAITIDNIPKKLLQAIKKNELVIFVGAGLSWNLENKNNQKIKGWNDLVREIIYHVTCNEEYDLSHLTSLIGKYDPIKILELIEDDCSKNTSLRKEISLFVKKFFDLHDSNNYDLHKNLFKLSNKIITTNYDTAFEIAVPELRKYKGYKGKLNELGNHTDPILPLLFKLHGCFEDINSMVLFPSDYNKLYNDESFNAQNALFVLGNIITNKTILFIGTGMGDFQINNIFQRIKTLQADNIREHFIITTDNKIDSRLDFVKSIFINDYKFINNVIDILLEEKKKYDNEKSPEMIELEEKLQIALKEVEESKEKLLHTTDIAQKQQNMIINTSMYLYIIGIQFEIDGDYGKAVEVYKQALEITPDDNNLYYSIGEALSNQAKLKKEEILYQDAIKYYNLAIDNGYVKDIGLNKIGEAYHNLRELKNDNSYYLKAVDYYQQAIAINSDSIYYNNLGITLHQLAELKEGEHYYDEAINAYKTAIKIKSDGVYYGNLGLLLFDLALLNNDIDLYQQAIQSYQEAINLEPKNSDLYNSLGNIYLEIKKFKEAIKYYEQAIQLDSFDSNIYYNAGQTYYEIANEEENEKNKRKLYIKAIKNLEKSIELYQNDKDHEVYNYLGLALYKLAMIANSAELYSRAIKNLHKAIEINSTEGYYYYNLASAFYELAQIKGTEKLYQEVIKYYDIFMIMCPDDIDDDIYNSQGVAYHELAQINEDESLYQEAIKCYQEAIKINPNDNILHENISRTFYELYIVTGDKTNFDEVIEYLKKSIELGSRYFEIAYIYLEYGNLEKALFYLEESLKKNEIRVQEVKENENWAEYLEDEDFKALLKKYEK